MGDLYRKDPSDPGTYGLAGTSSFRGSDLRTGENPYFPGLALHCAKAVFLQPFTGDKVMIQAPAKGWSEDLKDWVSQNTGTDPEDSGQE